MLYIWKYILKHSINHTDSIITCFSYFDTWNLSWKFRHFLWCDANQVVRKFPASVIPRNFTYITVTFSIFTLWRCRNWSYTTISCPSPHGRYTCLWNWTKFLLRTKPLLYELVINYLIMLMFRISPPQNDLHSDPRFKKKFRFICININIMVT